MAKTLVLEELNAEARRVIEEVLAAKGPVVVSRNGQAFGGMIAYAPSDVDTELSEAERAEIMDAIAKGEEDYAAGRSLTLNEFKAKYSKKLQSE